MSGTSSINLFPLPTRPSSVSPGQNPLAPIIWPGVSADSTKTLRRILTENNEKFHIFFNAQGFHNHIVHAVLSLWSLGAPPTVLEASFAEASVYQRKLFKSPNPIDQSNWKDHLGDGNYYQAYRHFFESENLKKGFDSLLEEYIFAADSNFIKGAAKQPEMLNRLMETAFHPMIHTGLAIEFGLPGTMAEALAQTAVHRGSSTAVIPPEWFEPCSNGFVSRFVASVDLEDHKPSKDVHAFTILSRVVNDPLLVVRHYKPEEFSFYVDVVKDQGNIIRGYVEQWTLEGDLQKKVEELLWTNTLIYAVGGSSSDGEFNADFFLVHGVTSSIFLPTIFSILTRESQIRLLRSYFSVSLTWYVGRGRPRLDLARFFTTATTLHPHAPGPQPTPHKDAHPFPSSSDAITPNSWLQIIQSTLVHPDDHVVKLQRALAHYGMHFGATPTGTFKDTELEGAELIDGTLFIRAAGLSAGRMGWVREGQPSHHSVQGILWDRHGFYENANP